MTISPKTIEKMRSMKDEGYTNKEIAKKCKVSIRVVGGKLKEKKGAESVTSQNLEEQLEILELRPKVESELNGMIHAIDEDDESILMNQLRYLQGKLENATGLKEIKKIEELIAEGEGSELSKKFDDAVDRRWKKVKREKEEERKKAEEKRKEYDRRYNWLKCNLVKVIEDVNGIISYPLTSEEIDDIIKETLPYGKPIFRLAEPSRFTRVLKNFGIPEDHAKIISNWWIKNYCKWGYEQRNNQRNNQAREQDNTSVEPTSAFEQN